MQPHIFIGTNPEACRLDKGSPITLSNTGTYIGGGRKQDISDTYFPLELLESTYPHMKINLSNTNPYILRIEDVSPNTNTFGIFRLLEPLIPTKINYNTQPFFISSDIMMILFNRNLHMKHMGNYPAELSIYSLDFQIDQKNPPWPLNVLQEYNMGHKFSFTIGKHKFTDNIVREELTVSDNHAQLDWNYMQASWNISDRGKELTGSLNGTWLKLDKERIDDPYPSFRFEITEIYQPIFRIGSSVYIKFGLPTTDQFLENMNSDSQGVNIR